MEVTVLKAFVPATVALPFKVISSVITFPRIFVPVIVTFPATFELFPVTLNTLGKSGLVIPVVIVWTAVLSAVADKTLLVAGASGAVHF